MSEGHLSEREAQLREALATPLDAAAALRTQRGKLRLVGDVAPTFPRVVVTGSGASFAVSRSLRVALREAGVEAISLPVDALAREPAAYLDGRSLLVCVGRSGDATPLVSLVSGVGALHARPFTIAVTASGGSGLAEVADVAITADVAPDTGPPLRVTSLVLSAIARLLVAGPHGEIDAVLAETDAVATRSVEIATRLAGMVPDRETALASVLGAQGGLLVLGRGAGRAAAELAGLMWLTNAGRAVHVVDADEAGFGPTEAVGAGIAVLVMSPGSATGAADRALAAEIAAAGSSVVFVGPEHAAPPGVDHVVATIVGRRGAADRGRPVGGLVRTDPATLA